MTQLFSHGQHEDLGGGRTKTTIGLKPVNYLKNGVYQRITNALGASGDSTLTIGVDELVQFRIRDRLAGNSPVLFFGKGQSLVRLTPLGTANTLGVVSGNSITFPEAWANADLQFLIGGHRLQKNIILRAGHPASFAFRVDSHAGFDPATLTFGFDFRMLQPTLENGIERVGLTWAVSQSGGKYILTATLPQGNYAGWTLDPTLVLQPDGTDGVDAVILESTPTTNYGTNVALAFGNNGGAIYRSLIQFNVSSIPATATAVSATLSIWISAGYGAVTGSPTLHRVLRAWTEAGATWNTCDGANNWGTAGCANTTSDREATTLGTQSIPNTAIAGDKFDFVLTAALVQDWWDGGLTNNGMLLKGPTETGTSNDLWAVCSSDHTTAAQRPKLVIDYTLPSAQSFFAAPVAGWRH